MRKSLMACLGIFGLVVLVGCGSRVAQRNQEARAALEAARAAGAPTRSPEQFQAAEQAVKETEALLGTGYASSVIEAETSSAVALIRAHSALVTANLRNDLEKVQSEAQTARQETARVRGEVQQLQAQARAELTRLQAQLRTAEEMARTAQARLDRAESQALQLRVQAARPAQAVAASAPAAPTRYVVRKGDTLRRIAARPEIYGDANQWQRLYQANRAVIGPDRKVKTGQILIVPKP